MMGISKKTLLNYTLFLGGLLLVCAGCPKTPAEKQQATVFEVDKDFQRGPLTVHVRVNKTKVTIADTIVVELAAGIEPDYEVKMPKVDKVLENFGIVDWDDLGKKLGENNSVITTFRYKLEPFVSGTPDLPAFIFEFYRAADPNDSKHELTTEPIKIEVTSLLGDQKANLKIADLEGVVKMPARTSYRWLWILAAVGVVGGIALGLYRRRRQVEELVRIFKPAHEIAYDRLRALVALELVKAGRIKEFYERISDILRHYIEHRFNLKAPERTTEEFLAELTSVNVFAESDRKRLGEFLQHCDMVKFAKYDPTTEQIQKTFDLVKDFIETTKSDDKKIDVTEMKTEPVIQTEGA